jgi:hypothetical protein
MRIKLRLAGLFGLTAVAALLAMAVCAAAAGASTFRSQSGSFPVSFLGEGLGEPTFLSEKLNSVKCHNSHSSGSVEGTSLAKVLILYLTGCELNAESPLKFKETCPSIMTKELFIRPLSKVGGTGTTTGVLVTATSGNIAEFTCTGSNKASVKVSGSVICESSPVGKLVTQGKIICKAGATHGSQELTKGELPSGASVTAGLTAESTLGIFKVTEKDSQTATEDVTYKEAVEQTETLPTWSVGESAGKQPVWLINGAELKAGEKRTATTGKEFIFLIEAEGTMLQIECLDATASVEFIGGAPGTDKGSMTFKECKVIRPVEGCMLEGEGAKGGEFTLTSSTELVISAGKFFDVFTGNSGDKIPVIPQTGKECPLEGIYSLAGKFAGEISGETILFGATLSELEVIRKNKEEKEVAKYPAVVKDGSGMILKL